MELELLFWPSANRVGSRGPDDGAGIRLDWGNPALTRQLAVGFDH
jgi:hypothetical protein